MPAAYCLLPLSFEKLLRFIQPSLFGSILIGRRGFHGLNTCLHRAGGFLVIAQSGVRASHQVESLRVVGAAVEKLLQRITRVAVLSGSDISRANLAPDFVLRVELITLDNLLETRNRLRQTSLRARNQTELIMRVQFFRVDIDRALEAFARFTKLAALLMNQSEVVVR